MTIHSFNSDLGIKISTNLPLIYNSLNEATDKLYTHIPIYACSKEGDCIIGAWEKRSDEISKSQYSNKYILHQEHKRVAAYFGFYIFECYSNRIRRIIAQKISQGYGINFRIDIERNRLDAALDGPYLTHDNTRDIPYIRGALGMTACAYNTSVRELKNQRRKMFNKKYL